jgi:hypothetical protein
MDTQVLRPVIRSPLQLALRSVFEPAGGSTGGGTPPETFYLLDESGNTLTDESGNRLTWN